MELEVSSLPVVVVHEAGERDVVHCSPVCLLRSCAICLLVTLTKTIQNAAILERCGKCFLHLRDAVVRCADGIVRAGDPVVELLHHECEIRELADRVALTLLDGFRASFPFRAEPVERVFRLTFSSESGSQLSCEMTLLFLSEIQNLLKTKTKHRYAACRLEAVMRAARSRIVACVSPIVVVSSARCRSRDSTASRCSTAESTVALVPFWYAPTSMRSSFSRYVASVRRIVSAAVRWPGDTT